jgi:hypothetical protein
MRRARARGIIRGICDVLAEKNPAPGKPDAGCRTASPASTSVVKAERGGVPLGAKSLQIEARSRSKRLHDLTEKLCNFSGSWLYTNPHKLRLVMRGLDPRIHTSWQKDS